MGSTEMKRCRLIASDVGADSALCRVSIYVSVRQRENILRYSVFHSYFTRKSATLEA